MRYAAIFVGVKTFRGSGWRRLLPPVPVTQCREQKDCRHAGQSASDKQNAAGVNEAGRGAKAFAGTTGKSLQDFPQPGLRRPQECILRGGVPQLAETRLARTKDTAARAKPDS